MSVVDVFMALSTIQALTLGYLGISHIMLHRRMRALERSPLLNRPGWVAGQPIHPSVLLRENGGSRAEGQ